MVTSPTKRSAAFRLCVLLGLALLLVSSFATGFHRHDASQESSCVVCHVSSSADLAAPAQLAENSPLHGSSELVAHADGLLPLDMVRNAGTPRAPPSLSHAIA